MSSDKNADLLIELGCEELPPRSVDKLRAAFFAAVAVGLEKAQISFDRDRSKQFSTPRRLAMVLSNVAGKQPDQEVEKRGPAVAAAFNDAGEPTPAASGFARSVGLEVSELDRMKTDKGEWLYCKQSIKGKDLGDLLFDIIESAIKTLPTPRPMRWSDNEFSFVRPVHWVIVMHGDTVLPGEILGKTTGNTTFAHRIHAPGPHTVSQASEYEQILLAGNVIANPQNRAERIVESLKSVDAGVIIDDGLLAEVNNLVEWPVAVSCEFDEEFLEVPHAALISTMQDHQRFFPVRASGENESGTAIANRFIAISNIDSTDFDQVRTGYERVVRPRLADSRFFLDQDAKKSLEQYAPLLDDVVFQKKIGSVGDKTRRIASISQTICEFLEISPDSSVRAAALCKCDLMTQMVGEFPELQGTMGEHYARASGESDEVSRAIGEHYSPRFAGDAIPASEAGRVIGIADRVDSLVAIFSAGLAPTGNKDPFALRRSALGLIRILSESATPLPVSKLLHWGADSLAENQSLNASVTNEVEAFILQRSRGHYRDQGYGTNLVSACLASPWKHFPDLDARLAALQAFMGREEAQSLATANKRIGNILRKAEFGDKQGVNAESLVLSEERRLYEDFERISRQVSPLLGDSDYPSGLAVLAEFKQPLDAFFDSVMVMDEEENLRRNRLSLLAGIKALFDEIADLSVLD